jgi:alkylation response protein AidB-like acyl-CoA dehydrogenase
MANPYNDDRKFYAEKLIDWKALSGGKLSTDEAAGMLASVGELAADLQKTAKDIDRKGTHFHQGKTYVPKELMDAHGKMREMGLTALSCAEEYGGMGMPITLNAMAADILAGASISPLLTAYLHCSADLYRFAPQECKTPELDDIVRKTLSGELLGAMVITEPGAGSDAFRKLRTEAYQEGGRWYLNGTKQFITTGCGETHVVLARTDKSKHDTNKGIGLFLVHGPVERTEETLEQAVETKPGHVMPPGAYATFRHTLQNPKGEPAIEIMGVEDKLGIKGSPTCALAYNSTPAHLISAPGAGEKEMLKLFDGARLVIAIQGVGIAQEAYDDALAYAQTRKQFDYYFDGPIANIPAVRKDLLGKAEDAWRAGRALAYDAGKFVDLALRETDEHRRKGLETLALGLTCLAKYWCAEKAIEGAIRSLQTFGGYGYTKEYPAERHLRDSIIASQYEGTTQIQQLFIMKSLGKLLKPLWREMESNLATARKDGSLTGLVRDAERSMQNLYRTSANMKLLTDDAIAGRVKPPMFEEQGCICPDGKTHAEKAAVNLVSYYGANVAESLAETYMATALLRQAPLRESKEFREYAERFITMNALPNSEKNLALLRRANAGLGMRVKEELGWRLGKGIK